MLGIRRFLSSLVSHPRRSEYFVSNDIVACPQRGDIPLEVCLACAQLRAVEGSPIQRIRCEASDAFQRLARESIA